MKAGVQDDGLQPLVQDVPGHFPQDGGEDGGFQYPESENGDLGSEFERDFDAGVDADEDEDPENYIRQLTGKLSQKINSFVSKNGNDESLTKYAAKMVIKAAADGMSEEGKKELIQSVNTTDSVEDGDSLEDTEESGLDNTDTGEGSELNEICVSKRKMQECLMSMNPSFETFRNDSLRGDLDGTGKGSIFAGKKFR